MSASAGAGRTERRMVTAIVAEAHELAGADGARAGRSSVWPQPGRWGALLCVRADDLIGNALWIVASHSTPSPVMNRVRSATHSRYGAGVLKSRWIAAGKNSSAYGRGTFR